mmetsp:Transcript_26720/g.39520  ORF Transcript_26720/g.39520 Transcript_26720/m.39520 type:complete len:152 (-) Transcript_26720:302-757(-)
MAGEKVRKEDLEAKVKEYSSFIDKMLYPKLNQRVQAREEVEQEIADYKDLITKLSELQHCPIEAISDLGFDTVLCRSVAHPAKKIFIHVGLGFHAEMTRNEGIDFCKKRISFLDDLLSRRVTEASEVARHIESSLAILEELAREGEEIVQE